MRAPEASWDKPLFLYLFIHFKQGWHFPWDKPLFLYLFIHFKQGWHFPSGSTDRTCDFDIPALVDGEGNENNFPQAKIIQDSKSHSWLFFFFFSPLGAISFWLCGPESFA